MVLLCSPGTHCVEEGNAGIKGMYHNSQLNITCFENRPCSVAQAGLVISWLGHRRAAVTNTVKPGVTGQFMSEF